jgi:cyclohexanone monooxygenase
VQSNVNVFIEQHVDWIADCIRHLRARGLRVVEAGVEAEDAGVARVAR